MKAPQQFNLLQGLRAILAKERSRRHHFGRPMMTAYQLAIELRAQHPIYMATWPLGGAGAGGQSLARHVALELSRAIKDGRASDIEAAFLSNDHLEDVVFERGIRSTLTVTGRGVSMFRLKA